MNGLTKKDFVRALETKSQRMFGRTCNTISKNQLYKAIAMVVRDLVMERWAYSRGVVHQNPERELYYLSMEFLMGQSLGSNMLNLEIDGIIEEVCEDFGVALDEICELEPDAGLGNGGLGRLAACFLDSLSTLGMPAHGCGIRYEYGLFKQKIVDGYQIELVDPWLEDGNVWELPVPEETQIVRFGGYVEQVYKNGKLTFEHKGYQQVRAVPYEIPVLGYKSPVVNTLRLWGARAMQHMDMDLFGQGKYMRAIEEKELAEVISKVLYPEDNHPEGKALRLKQQYFFASASIQHMVSTFKARNKDIRDLAKQVVVQINDTHPALAIPELMRILIDEEGLGWDEAWEITRQTFAYTNHTIMEEALEKWPVDLFQSLLPRLWDIVYEINERFCRMLWERYPGEWERIARLAIIADQQVKMAHLCIVGSFSVNGVAQLHTNILKEIVFKDFYEIYPDKFTGITNGITFRRFILQANPHLADLISSKIGEEWIVEPTRLREFAEYSQDAEVQQALRRIRYQNKLRLAAYIEQHNGIKVDPNSIFDVQIKRLHEYKRQLLNALHIMALYNRLLADPDLEMTPRTFIFGAKAAPGYRMAKLIIKLIHSIGEAVSHDPRINDKLKVVFLENYRVSLAELVIPAADVSEQISTAGKEASGTGNMKFMLNGALTVGTLDGANVEIEEEVGSDNIFIFGLPSALVNRYYRDGNYCPRAILEQDPELNLILEQLVNGFLPVEHPDMFKEIYEGLKYGNGDMADSYFVIKDFASYSNAHRQIDQLYRQPQLWWEKAIINIAHAGRFSSDRTIEEYNQHIWHLPRFA
ncbi:MAG: glycogen/starch/alpha-glucan phosphorylase [Firmicutes bacterium]|nr:glycogen/starch/alpha-glucan phosphorylase [Bacillota bacterium]